MDSDGEYERTELPPAEGGFEVQEAGGDYMEVEEGGAALPLMKSCTVAETLFLPQPQAPVPCPCR